MPDANSASPRSRKRKLLPLSFSAIALLLAVTIIAGCLTNWFGFYGPTTKLLLAGKKTLNAPSFTARAELQVGHFNRSIEVQGQINTHQREITLVGRYEDEALIRFAVYKGFLIHRTGVGKYSALDIHAELDQLFNRIEENEDTDWEALLQSVSQSIYEKYGDRLNYDEIDSALLSLYRLSNKPKWLESTAGLTIQTEGNVTSYRFAPEKDAATSILECFEKVFTPEDYDGLVSRLSNQQENLQILEPVIECSVHEGYLTSVRVSAQKNDIPIVLSATFENIGTTAINYEELSDLLARAS